MAAHHHRSRRTGGLAVALTCASTLLLASPPPANAQDAATLYERAQAREATARAVAPPALSELRSAARAYENIVRRYWKSGYCDNALLQAAGLMGLAYERSGTAADRQKAESYLDWLSNEYPHTSLLDEAALQRRQLAEPAESPDPPAEAAGPALVRSVSRAALPHGDRVTIELTREVAYSGDRVDGPDRLFFDFAESQPASSLQTLASSLDSTLIKDVRIGRHPGSVTRVVFELDGAPKHSAFLLYEPFRLVIDLESDTTTPVPSTPATLAAAQAPTTSPATTSAVEPATIPPALPAATPPVVAAATPPVTAPPTPAPAPPPAPTSATTPPQPVGHPDTPASTSDGDYSLARQLGLSVSRIVIDAGHGGIDRGASANGLIEKDLVLDVAERLEALLTAHPGVEVVLTRSTDSYIPLEERTAIANQQGADLFLSIHANASSRSSTRGVETYVLNFATNAEAEAVAARENATSARAMGALPEIVKTIALNNKLAESRELATMVQTALVRSLRAKSTAVRDLGVKQAPFVVLIGAEMPSVLAEISFLTNRSEANLLKESSYRQRIAQALHDAVVKYQASLKKITFDPPAGGSR